MRAGPQLSGRDRCQLLLWQGEEHPFWRKHLSPGIGRINGGESLPCEKVPRPAVAGEPGLPARHGLCRPTPTPVIVQWGGISSRWPLHFGSSRCTSTRLSELTLRPWESKSPTRSRIPLMWRTCSVWESQGQDSCLALFPEHLYLLCPHGSFLGDIFNKESGKFTPPSKAQPRGNPLRVSRATAQPFR